jgi:predicted  nucleic acid-binding Zn-ribbon protein
MRLTIEDMSDSDDNYIGILLEEIRDEIKAVHEEVGGMREELANVPKREEFDELKQDVKVIKAAVTDLSHEVSGHEHRIGNLETAH